MNPLGLQPGERVDITIRDAEILTDPASGVPSVRLAIPNLPAVHTLPLDLPELTVERAGPVPSATGMADLEEAKRWLKPCRLCCLGQPHECALPPGSWRTMMAALIDEVAEHRRAIATSRVRVPMTQGALESVLVEMAARVRLADSFEGSIEYLAPTAEDGEVPGDAYAMVTGAFRFGSFTGESGVTVIGRPEVVAAEAA